LRSIDDVPHVGYVAFWTTLATAASLGLWFLGIRGDWAHAACHITATVTGTAVSPGRRRQVVDHWRWVQARLARLHTEARNTRPPIVRPPASRLARVARLLWSARTNERVFMPARADIIHEWLLAEAAGDRRQAWWIRYVRGPSAMLHHMAAQLPYSLLKAVIELWTAAK
jgi:hypothetical protein